MCSHACASNHELENVSFGKSEHEKSEILIPLVHFFNFLILYHVDLDGNSIFDRKKY